MTASISGPCIPSEFDDEVDDAGHARAYPCKLPLCPDHGKPQGLWSKRLTRDKRNDARCARRKSEKEWRYTTDANLPPRAGPDFVSREDPDEYVVELRLRT
ncbi:hypothetical protein EJ04DRAFT_605117 [Polyplosphaeria fusca]|uniref:Uncharacterized protein n=1 Tax=Polyplosphaeria fusca TaxID=682080 RepID=A0A9P4QZH2_9PLEO|nr:hypothetical protein EJ04DRAFT_605117 [Polyplosphaeria fusca]